MHCWSCFLDKLQEIERNIWLDLISQFPEVDFEICEVCDIEINWD